MKKLATVSSGFTLTEVAVVLVIVALLIGGMLMPLSAQQEMHGRSDTEKAEADIRDAILGFAAINGRLPCPAEADIASGATNAGIEAATGTGSALTCACSSGTSDVAQQGSTACSTGSSDTVAGVVPWATLGLPEQDPWGNRYTYRVTTFFARGIAQSTFGCTPGSTPTQTAFALCSSGGITVNTAQSSGVTLASNVPAIIVSHGRTGGGGYTSSGTQVISSPSTDEQENYDADAIYVSNTTIDDQLLWIPSSLLMNRMLTAGKLP